MDYRLLIKGGTVVDGTGAPAYAADVRIADGRIAEVGPELQSGRGERVVDATGCYVTPGFIEMHNHWDVGGWWTPNMDPLPGYGATTSINGDCGFSLAPAPRGEAEKQNVIDIFNFFEDIPEEPMRKLVPWDWQSWSEYKASMVRNVSLLLNYATRPSSRAAIRANLSVPRRLVLRMACRIGSRPVTWRQRRRGHQKLQGRE